MDTVLWITAGVLAFAFAAAGLLKLTQPKPKLAAFGLAWTEDFSDGQVKSIGAVEVLGAIGLIMPAALGVAEVLTPMAAAGLALTMAGAAITHLRRKEGQMVPINVVLGGLALFVAMRFGPDSF